MPELETYLSFNGNCAEAMRSYERTLGGKLELMTHGESPMADQVPAAHRDKIMHSRLVVDGHALMGSDMNAGDRYEEMKGFYVSLNYAKVADAQKVFDALAKSGRVVMPLGKTFWADAFGMLVDRFGTPWMINGGPPKM